MTKFSIIMPVYRAESTIERSLLSINNQTILQKREDVHFDIICIFKDDNDPTLEICKKISNHFSKKITLHTIFCPIKGVIPARNAGLFHAFNIGFDIFCSLDADDVWMDSKIEKQFKFFEDNPDYYVVGSQIEIVNEKYEKFDQSNYPSNYEEIKEWIKRGVNPIANSSAIVKKEVFIRCGSYDMLYTCEDFYLWTRASYYYKIHNINENLIQYLHLGVKSTHNPYDAPICAFQFYKGIELMHSKTHFKEI